MSYNTSYSYVMMDRKQFEWYQKHCKKNGFPCNYHQVNFDCYGVMIPNKRLEGNIEKVQKVEVK